MIANASCIPVPESPTAAPGSVGGPSAVPVVENAPAAFCAIGSKHLYSANGPDSPKPFSRA